MIDVHAHLDFIEESYLGTLIENAKEAGVKAIITNTVNIPSLKKSLEITNKYPDIVKLAAGLYPEESLQVAHFDTLKKFVLENKDKIIALGEIGLDLHHQKENFEIQKEVFTKHLELAKELNLPVIIHTRKAEIEILDILEDYKDSLKIILHCFSGKKRLIERAIEMGCYFSIPTNVVRAQNFQWLVQNAPKDKILTETDAPYLSPHKDKSNEPAFVAESLKMFSLLWKQLYENVEKQIDDNYKRVFK